ncbi:hypothetical protein [Pedobacter gandavensis]|uniref:DUF4595 domain-containing protein n=1 Tax=Pedobacter gandavensis TaxID=2679963 RepID=A0ABR6EZS1_9SPHI|nr:hypothetical protein [Pedobacter gandavensis]MBB2150788.1 hypothetical protein [Pedobacter gandavensis]
MNRKIIFPIGTLLLPLFLVVLCFILLGYGCQKNEESVLAPTKDKEKPKEPEKPIPAKPVMVPSGITTTNLRTEFKYEGETSRLTEITQSDGRITKFFYRPDGTPLTYEYYKDNKLQQYLDYFLNKEGQIYKISLFDGKSTSSGYYSIIYNEEGQISEVKKYGVNSKIFEEEKIGYDSLGNANSIAVTNNGKTTTRSSTYDDRAGIYQHIPYLQLFLLTQQQSSMIFSKSNPLQIDYLPTAVVGSVYTYEYNTNNYPSSLSRKQGNAIETMKITYKTIKPK